MTWSNLMRDSNFLVYFGYEAHKEPDELEMSDMLYGCLFYRFGKIVTADAVWSYFMSRLPAEYPFTSKTICMWMNWFVEYKPVQVKTQPLFCSAFSRLARNLNVECVWYLLYEGGQHDVLTSMRIY